MDDFRFYGGMCRIFGIILLIAGIAVALFTTSWRTFFGRTYYDAPYLGQGSALAVMGVILIVVSYILYREYYMRITEPQQAKPAVPSAGFCPYCGTAREEGSAYCRKCGQKLP